MACTSYRLEEALHFERVPTYMSFGKFSEAGHSPFAKENYMKNFKLVQQ